MDGRTEFSSIDHGKKWIKTVAIRSKIISRNMTWVWVINFSFTRTAEKDKKRNKNAIPRATMLKIT